MKNKIPGIKKDLKMFLSSEEAKITKKKAVKMGIGLLTVLVVSQILSVQSEAQAGAVSNEGGRGRHTSHSSHGSHGSHGSW